MNSVPNSCGRSVLGVLISYLDPPAGASDLSTAADVKPLCFPFLGKCRYRERAHGDEQSFNGQQSACWLQHAQYEEGCPGPLPLYLKHGQPQGAHAMVQAGQRKDPHQQGLSQAPDVVLKAPHKLFPDFLRPAQAFMAHWVMQAVLQALGALR